MRLEVTFQAKSMPIYYRMGIVSIVKESLRKADKAYFEKIFADDRSMKPFAYSVYLQDYQIQQDTISVKSFKVIYSSSDQEFMMHLYNGLMKINKINYLGHEWQRDQIRMLPEKHIQSEKVLMKTLSPLLIENKQGKPLSPDSSDYQAEFNYYADLTVQRMLGRRLKRNITVTPLNMKKTVIKESNRAIRNNLNAREDLLFFTAYKGLLILEGHHEDLMCVYQNGISRRRSLGFGLLEVEMEGGA